MQISGAHELTVIAETGERFTDFSPYVPAINEAGLVSFQASLSDGNTGVFTGADGEIGLVATSAEGSFSSVVSHPALNDAGDITFFATRADGERVVMLARGRSLRCIADREHGVAAAAPLGPTINARGTVAFRGRDDLGNDAIFSWCEGTVVRVACASDHFAEFHGLPLAAEDDSIVFRADDRSGVRGIHQRTGDCLRTLTNSERTMGAFPSVNRRGTVAFTSSLATGEPAIMATRLESTEVFVLVSSGPFASFRGALTFAGDAVVFYGTPRGGQLGVYAELQPSALRIVEVGSAVLDSTVDELALNPVSVNETGQLAIRLGLASGKQLIVRVDPIVQER